MFSYMLFFSFIAFINAYKPSCISCKFYISPNKNYDYPGFCKRFKNISNKDKSVIIYDYAIDCRSNENKCGKEGILYEQNDEFVKNNFLEDYEQLNNRCCGEVNEKDELEELEKEFFEIFQRIKKYNKKRFINSANDLYKLFKDKQ